MRKRALIVAGTLAVLLTGLAPVGDGCALASAIDHDCCEANEPVPTASCCSKSDEGAAEPVSEQQLGCDCLHPADVTGQAALSKTAKPSDDDPSFEVLSDRLADNRPTTTRRSAFTGSFRAHPPPPTFLLDCAFLI